MKRMLIGFMLGVVTCLSVGAAMYRPSNGVTVFVSAGESSNFRTIMKNQEAIYNLINARCGER